MLVATLYYNTFMHIPTIMIRKKSGTKPRFVHNLKYKMKQHSEIQILVLINIVDQHLINSINPYLQFASFRLYNPFNL